MATFKLNMSAPLELEAVDDVFVFDLSEFHDNPIQTLDVLNNDKQGISPTFITGSTSAGSVVISVAEDGLSLKMSFPGEPEAGTFSGNYTIKDLLERVDSANITVHVVSGGE